MAVSKKGFTKGSKDIRYNIFEIIHLKLKVYTAEHIRNNSRWCIDSAFDTLMQEKCSCRMSAVWHSISKCPMSNNLKSSHCCNCILWCTVYRFSASVQEAIPIYVCSRSLVEVSISLYVIVKSKWSPICPHVTNTRGWITQLHIQRSCRLGL